MKFSDLMCPRLDIRFMTAACAATLALAGSASAGTLVWSLAQPTVDGADIANFVGASSKETNVLSTNAEEHVDGPLYVAMDRPFQGQTFTTTSATNQVLHAVTLQMVTYSSGWSVDAGWYPYNGGRQRLFIGTIVNGSMVLMRAEEAPMSLSGIPNIDAGGWQGGDGTGAYATITLATPVNLEPNTTYAFTWGAWSDDMNDGPYWECNGISTTSENYTGGEAISLSGSPREGLTLFVQERIGDRVFHLDISGDPAGGNDWAGLPIDENGWVDSGEWMGPLHVLESPWVFSPIANAWLFIDLATLTESGGWAYLPYPLPAGDPGEGPAWGGLAVDENGWVHTGAWMGPLNVSLAPWVYVAAFDSWLYVDADSFTASGGWIFVPNY